MLKRFSPSQRLLPHNRYLERCIFYAPDDTANTPAPTPNTPAPDSNATLLQALQRLQNSGDQSALAQVVQQQAARIEQLLQRQTPEGALVLTGDQVALWNTLKDIKPDEVAKLKSDLEAAQAQLVQSQRDKIINRAAEALGYKASVLSKLQDLPPIEVSEKDENGKKVTVVEVVKDNTRTPLADYVTAHYADFLPALQAAQASQGQQQQKGVQFPPQSAGKPESPKNPADDYISRTYKRPATTS